MKHSGLFRENASDKDDCRMRIKVATGEPIFSSKMAVGVCAVIQ